MMRRRTVGVFAFLAPLVVAVTGACGISADDQPRNVLPAERPTVPTTAPAGSAQPGSGSIVFFLGLPGESAVAPLVGVGRPDTSEPSSLVSLLLEGPTETERSQSGLRTAVPAGTALINASLDTQGTLTVDLSADFLSSAGDVLLDAVAQIVFTATRAENVRRVRLLIEGEPQDWPTSSGTTTRDPLSIYDFLERTVEYTTNRAG